MPGRIDGKVAFITGAARLSPTSTVRGWETLPVVIP